MLNLNWQIHLQIKLISWCCPLLLKDKFNAEETFHYVVLSVMYVTNAAPG